MRNRAISWRGFAIAISGVLAISALLHAAFELPFWITAGVIAAAMMLNGAVAVVEDDAPGGFNNPDKPSE